MEENQRGLYNPNEPVPDGRSETTLAAEVPKEVEETVDQGPEDVEVENTEEEKEAGVEEPEGAEVEGEGESNQPKGEGENKDE
jgi:hypothetical protein